MYHIIYLIASMQPVLGIIYDIFVNREVIHSKRLHFMLAPTVTS